MKKFCKKTNKEVDLRVDGKNMVCADGMEVECTQAMCRYCLGVNMRISMFGDSLEKYPDYTG
jgi:hypothetical protein